MLDLGGVHQRLPGLVSIAADGSATITEGGSLDGGGRDHTRAPAPTRTP